jgi:chain length determinant protein EpsF
MTFGQFLSMVGARWRLVAAIVALVTLTALGVSLMLPKQYEATASLVFDMRPDPVAPGGYDSLSWPVYLATQVQILESERVAERVVDALGMKSDGALRERWSKAGELGSYEAWLTTLVRKSLNVRLTRETNVIRVGYKASDAQSAAKAANAVVQGYLDTVLDMRVNPARQYSTMFEQRAKELRTQLEKAQANLSAFQRQKGIVANDERLDVETARLNELSAQLVALQAVAAESSGRQSAVARTIEQSPDVQASPLVSSLKGDLLRQEARLQELNSRLGDAHPQVVEARANIAALRSRIDGESRRVAGSVGVTNTINRQREAEIRAAYETQRQRVLRLKEVRDESQVYQREVDAAQRALDAVMTRFNQSALESQSTQSNASVLAQATSPLLPTSPRIVLNTLVAAFLSSLAAVALAVMLESMNRRVRSVEDVTQALGVPVLGSLPVADRTVTFGGKAAQPALAQRVLGQLPLSRP